MRAPVAASALALLFACLAPPAPASAEEPRPEPRLAGGLSVDRLGGGLGLLWRAADDGRGRPGGFRLGPRAGASFAPGGGGATATLALAGVYAFPLGAEGRWALAVDCQLGCSWLRSGGAWSPVLHFGPSFQVLVDALP